MENLASRVGTDRRKDGTIVDLIRNHSIKVGDDIITISFDKVDIEKEILLHISIQNSKKKKTEIEKGFYLVIKVYKDAQSSRDIVNLRKYLTCCDNILSLCAKDKNKVYNLEYVKILKYIRDSIFPIYRKTLKGKAYDLIEVANSLYYKTRRLESKRQQARIGNKFDKSTSEEEIIKSYVQCVSVYNNSVQLFRELRKIENKSKIGEIKNLQTYLEKQYRILDAIVSIYRDLKEYKGCRDLEKCLVEIREQSEALKLLNNSISCFEGDSINTKGLSNVLDVFIKMKRKQVMSTGYLGIVYKIDTDNMVREMLLHLSNKLYSSEILFKNILDDKRLPSRKEVENIFDGKIEEIEAEINKNVELKKIKYEFIFSLMTKENLPIKMHLDSKCFEFSKKPDNKELDDICEKIYKSNNINISFMIEKDKINIGFKPKNYKQVVLIRKCIDESLRKIKKKNDYPEIKKRKICSEMNWPDCLDATDQLMSDIVKINSRRWDIYKKNLKRFNDVKGKSVKSKSFASDFNLSC